MIGAILLRGWHQEEHLKRQTLLERAKVRRKDRQVEDDAFIVGLLRRVPMAAMATVAEGQPFINTNTFVYDEGQHAIYMHTSRMGRTPSNVRVGCDPVCLTVTEMGRLLPGARAFNMSVEYESAIIFGRAKIVEDVDEQVRALDLLVRRYFRHLTPGDDYALPDEDELKLTAVYRIDIEEWTGKRKAVEAEYPGAFRWEEASTS